jgi:hypothetical protein
VLVGGAGDDKFILKSGATAEVQADDADRIAFRAGTSEIVGLEGVNASDPGDFRLNFTHLGASLSDISFAGDVATIRGDTGTAVVHGLTEDAFMAAYDAGHVFGVS